MPIPLGIIAVAGAGAAGGAGAFDLLETTVLGSDAASVTFSSLGSYSNYKHLQVRAVVRSSRSSSVDNLILRINSDSGTNYAAHSLVGTGSGVSSNNRTSETHTLRNKITGNTATANSFAAVTIDVLDFSSTSKNTTVRALGGMHETTASQYEIGLYSGAWFNTAAVTSLTFSSLQSANLLTNSRFSLYGIK
jgi:hypothetical protein